MQSIRLSSFNILFYFFVLFLTTSQAESKTREIQGGWHQKFPYQYLRVPVEMGTLTGLDIELKNMIFDRAGLKNSLVFTSWEEHLFSLKKGTMDFAMGIHKTPRLSEEFLFSDPYRYEESAVFFRKKDRNLHDYKDIQELLEVIRIKRLKVGVVRGYQFADKDLNNFIYDANNRNQLVFVLEDVYSISLLLKKQIDLFITDRVVAANYIAKAKLGSLIDDRSINIKSPVYFMFSRKSFSRDSLAKVNKAIAEVKKESKYDNLLESSMHPVWVINTVQANWYSIIEYMGIVAFALSGLLLGYRYHASLFGTLILAAIPSVSGLFIRDFIAGRFPVSFMDRKYNLILILIVTVVGFLILKIFNQRDLKRKKATEAERSHLFEAIRMFTDAMGLCSFAAAGVVATIAMKATPIILWGVVFSFISGAFGCFIRGLFLKDIKLWVIANELYSEFALIIGVFLSFYVSYYGHTLNPDDFKMVIILTVVGGNILMFFCRVNGIKNVFIRNPD